MSGGGLHPDDATVLRLLDPAATGDRPRYRTPCILGVFAHPDDEVFCVGGTLARCAAEGADTAVVSLTRGEAGEIRRSGDARLGPVGVGPTADDPGPSGCLDPAPMFDVDERPALHCKVAALAAHRSQYAMAADTFPHAVHDRLLGTEYFVVADPAQATRTEVPR